MPDLSFAQSCAKRSQSLRKRAQHASCKAPGTSLERFDRAIHLVNMAHNTSTISARVPNATKRRLHRLSEQWNVAPSTIMRALLNMLPLRTYTAEQKDALGKLLEALGLPGNASPDAVRDAVNKVLGIDGLGGDGGDDDPGGGQDMGAVDAAPEAADPEAPAPRALAERSDQRSWVPSPHEVERVAARLSELGVSSALRRPVSSGGIRPAPVPPFVMGPDGAPILNPARRAR